MDRTRLFILTRFVNFILNISITLSFSLAQRKGTNWYDILCKQNGVYFLLFCFLFSRRSQKHEIFGHVNRTAYTAMKGNIPMNQQYEMVLLSWKSRANEWCYRKIHRYNITFSCPLLSLDLQNRSELWYASYRSSSTLSTHSKNEHSLLLQSKDSCFSIFLPHSILVCPHRPLHYMVSTRLLSIILMQKYIIK